MNVLLTLYTGESVLSLLIVPIVKGEFEFYLTFFVGVLSVIFLQFLYFKSQPHHANDHALRRSRSAGVFFSAVLQCYSAGLVLVGVCFKMILSEFKNDEVTMYSKSSSMPGNDRLLAGGDSPLYSKEEKRQRIAYFFCISLACVFVFLDGLSLSHKGVKASVDRCHCPLKGHFLLAGVLLVVVFRIAISVFIGTACLYVTSPDTLALFGLTSIFLQVWIRIIGGVFFPSHDHVVEVSENHEEAKQEDHEEREFINDPSHWPNTTQPAVEHDSKPN